MKGFAILLFVVLLAHTYNANSDTWDWKNTQERLQNAKKEAAIQKLRDLYASLHENDSDESVEREPLIPPRTPPMKRKQDSSDNDSDTSRSKDSSESSRSTDEISSSNSRFHKTSGSKHQRNRKYDWKEWTRNEVPSERINRKSWKDSDKLQKIRENLEEQFKRFLINLIPKDSNRMHIIEMLRQCKVDLCQRLSRLQIYYKKLYELNKARYMAWRGKLKIRDYILSHKRNMDMETMLELCKIKKTVPYPFQITLARRCVEIHVDVSEEFELITKLPSSINSVDERNSWRCIKASMTRSMSTQKTTESVTTTERRSRGRGRHTTDRIIVDPPWLLGRETSTTSRDISWPGATGTNPQSTNTRKSSTSGSTKTTQSSSSNGETTKESHTRAGTGTTEHIIGDPAWLLGRKTSTTDRVKASPVATRRTTHSTNTTKSSTSGSTKTTQSSSSNGETTKRRNTGTGTPTTEFIIADPPWLLGKQSSTTDRVKASPAETRRTTHSTNTTKSSTSGSTKTTQSSSSNGETTKESHTRAGTGTTERIIGDPAWLLGRKTSTTDRVKASPVATRRTTHSTNTTKSSTSGSTKTTQSSSSNGETTKRRNTGTGTPTTEFIIADPPWLLGKQSSTTDRVKASPAETRRTTQSINTTKSSTSGSTKTTQSSSSNGETTKESHTRAGTGTTERIIGDSAWLLGRETSTTDRVKASPVATRRTTQSTNTTKSSTSGSTKTTQSSSSNGETTKRRNTGTGTPTTEFIIADPPWLLGRSESTLESAIPTAGNTGTTRGKRRPTSSTGTTEEAVTAKGLPEIALIIKRTSTTESQQGTATGSIEPSSTTASETVQTSTGKSTHKSPRQHSANRTKDRVSTTEKGSITPKSTETTSKARTGQADSKDSKPSAKVNQTLSGFSADGINNINKSRNVISRNNTRTTANKTVSADQPKSSSNNSGSLVTSVARGTDTKVSTDNPESNIEDSAGGDLNDSTRNSSAFSSAAATSEAATTQNEGDSARKSSSAATSETTKRTGNLND